MQRVTTTTITSHHITQTAQPLPQPLLLLPQQLGCQISFPNPNRALTSAFPPYHTATYHTQYRNKSINTWMSYFYHFYFISTAASHSISYLLVPGLSKTGCGNSSIQFDATSTFESALRSRLVHGRGALTQVEVRRGAGYQIEKFFLTYTFNYGIFINYRINDQRKIWK